ncbi:hypothetical protein WJX74_008849 [Apatococcus lobatus]|uniref:Uncharacterized protein n=1 Tax=Apatococcus lobatus TaxID=904363 RepID=A0AAW1RLS0_9CHLO
MDTTKLVEEKTEAVVAQGMSVLSCKYKIIFLFEQTAKRLWLSHLERPCVVATLHNWPDKGCLPEDIALLAYDPLLAASRVVFCEAPVVSTKPALTPKIPCNKAREAWGRALLQGFLGSCLHLLNSSWVLQ